MPARRPSIPCSAPAAILTISTRRRGGSSGGATVALACGMVPIADGSDLGGSLRNPASFCNVVGLRPSPGRVPNWPSLSAWFPMGVVGPMARTVQDVALTMSAIAGPDARAPTSLQEPGLAFTRPLARNFKGARIAWSRDLGGLPFERKSVQSPRSNAGYSATSVASWKTRHRTCAMPTKFSVSCAPGAWSCRSASCSKASATR